MLFLQQCFLFIWAWNQYKTVVARYLRASGQFIIPNQPGWRSLDCVKKPEHPGEQREHGHIVVLQEMPKCRNSVPKITKSRNRKWTSLPWTSNTLQCWEPCLGGSFFPPLLMKFRVGRLGLRWSPTNFPGCCPIRAGCQAGGGTHSWCWWWFWSRVVETVTVSRRVPPSRRPLQRATW